MTDLQKDKDVGSNAYVGNNDRYSLREPCKPITEPRR